jgi:putative heme iron utilization protein
MNDWAASARRFVRGSESGSLATLSRRHGGYPFGSVVSFVSDSMARPVILVSRLAEHTANLGADPRASLLVQQPGPDPQAVARVTVIGDASGFEPGPAFVERYVRYLPQAGRLLQLGDFSFVRVEPMAVRFIAGFGAIRWVPPGEYAPQWSPDPDAEARFLGTLSDKALARLHGDAKKVEALGLDCDGIDVRADGKRVRIDFPAPVASVDALSAALEELR